MKQRLLGGMFFIAGLFLSYFGVYVPLVSAAEQAPSLSLSMKGTLLCPAALVIGLMYIVLGPKVETLLGTSEDPKPAAYVLGVVLIGMGIALYFWLKWHLEGMGFQF